MTKNFKREEFMCKCGCGENNISKTVVLVCQLVRDTFKKPVTVTSGCRCSTHNIKVGGASNSQHLPKGDGLCHAADIKVKNTEPIEVYKYIDSIFPNSLGLGIYPTFVHIDDRISKAYRWDFR